MEENYLKKKTKNKLNNISRTLQKKVHNIKEKQLKHNINLTSVKTK